MLRQAFLSCNIFHIYSIIIFVISNIISENVLPTQAPTDVQALPSEMQQSSSDPVQTNEPMDWESAGQNGEDQHQEGLSDAANCPKEGMGN